MDLKWPSLVVILPLALLALLALASRRPRTRPAPDALRMAHVTQLRRLARYRRLLGRRTALLVWLTLGGLVAAGGAVLLAARPQGVRYEQTERPRDVMLCLDASVSMYAYNQRVLAQVREVVDDLGGARVGLTVFSGAAVTLIPLTEDLDYVALELERAERSFDTGGYLYIAGIDLDKDPRSSLLGDGIVSCTQRFGDLDDDRARSMIVASDNDPVGDAVYSVQQGADYASERDVVVHAIAAPAVGDGRRRAELEDAAVSTGGSFATLGDDGTADELVSRIESQDARRAVGPPRRIVSETPRRGTWVLTSGVGILAAGWVVESWWARPRRRRDAT